ncbi:ABC transporter substrate-binding protein [Neptunomonas sp.]|uniref:ABC transporter substrate-binding protein n=1 Tax=Neptunomonas sp. TaxID=1971898 RepID=UPI0025CE1013|nr:ABC transporter substrate-binding protein [Neptunomonas sp.]
MFIHWMFFKRAFRCLKCRPALLLLLFYSASNVCAQDTIVLQLKWKHQFQFAGYYAAQKEGYFTAEGLDVEIRDVDEHRSATDIVLSGDAQFGITDSSVVLSRLKGRSVVVVAAIFQHSPMVLLALESSGILNPLELRNKRIMYQRNIDDAALLAMFTELGLTEYDHTHVPQNFRDDALLSGNADAMSAYITDQPYFYKEKGLRVNVMSPATYGVDFYGDMLFVDERFLKLNKEKVLAFRRATLKGWQYAVEHQKEMVDWIRKNLDTDKSREHLLYEAKYTIDLIQPQDIELGYFSPNRFVQIAETYKQLGLAPLTADIEGLNYTDYYEKRSGHMPWLLLVMISISMIFVLWAFTLWIKWDVVFSTKKESCSGPSLKRY